MSLAASIASWLPGLSAFATLKRAASPRPIEIVPGTSRFFGPGILTQPAHSTLLAETIGIPATATRAIAGRLSELNPQVLVTRRVSDGTTEDEVLDDHPLKRLLDKPHPQFSRAKLLRLTGQWVLSTGEAYWQKVGNGLGVPAELHPIPPGMVEPVIERNVTRSYRISDANGSQFSVPANQMVRIFFPDPENPWRSEGYLGPTGIEADAHKFAGQHLRAHYQSDATPRTVMKAGTDAEPFDEEQKKQFYALWREFYASRGGTRSGLPAMLPTGWDIEELAMQTGADMTPLLEYWRDCLLMAFNTPRAVLGQVVSGDRSSAETMQWVFDRFAVSPIATLIAEDLTHQLAPDFDASLKVCFEPFVSEDKEYKLKKQAQDLTQMVTTVNEVRVSEGLDEVEWGEQPIGTRGDVPYDPEAAAERANRPPQPPGAPNGGGGPEAVDGDEEQDEEERARQLQAVGKRRNRRARRSGRMKVARPVQAALVLLAMLLVPVSAFAQAKNRRQVALAATTITDAASVVVTLDNPNHTMGYLIVTTAAEIGVSVLTIDVAGTSVLGDTALCTLTVITTNTTTKALLGSLAAAAGGVTDVCDFPLPRRVKLTFTVSGTTPSFSVTADMEWLSSGAY